MMPGFPGLKFLFSHQCEIFPFLKNIAEKREGQNWDERTRSQGTGKDHLRWKSIPLDLLPLF
jgi:hypothetical protein